MALPASQAVFANRARACGRSSVIKGLGLGTPLAYPRLVALRLVPYTMTGDGS